MFDIFSFLFLVRVDNFIIFFWILIIFKFLMFLIIGINRLKGVLIVILMFNVFG